MRRKEIYELHAKTNSYQSRLRVARRIVKKAMAIDTDWYVAFSGGKDSTVVAALAAEQKNNIPLIWSDDEWWLPETEEYMSRIANLHHIRTNTCHAEWFHVSGDWDGIPEYAKSKGLDGCFLGLRQEESNRRRVYLRTYGPLHYANNNHQWQCNPIHDWIWLDVWAYIYSNDLDYNRAYDRLDEIGVEPKNQRIGPFAVDRALRYGQLAILKKGWPDVYNKFAARYPEARAH